jgi:DNA-3-methyladenine glycosylase II
MLPGMLTTAALPAAAPFDFAHTLAFVSGFSPMAGEQTVSAPSPVPDARLTKALSLDGRAVVFRVRPAAASAADGAGDPERPSLAVDLFSADALAPAGRRAALARIASYLGAGDDLDAFYAAAAPDRAFAPLTRKYRGLRHVRFPTPFEAACWGVINQRTQLSTARRMKDALTRRAGPSLTVDGVEYRAFPEPDAVARLDDAELAAMLPGGRRAKAVTALARAFVDIDERFLHEAPVAEVREWLRAIHGVGPFTSGFVLYRGLGRFDGAALVAPRFVEAASHRYGRTLSAHDVRRLAESYGPWGGYWMLYVWASTFL